ncbi:hypothetical protein ACROYT_G014518 [Oculina patagonica]
MRNRDLQQYQLEAQFSLLPEVVQTMEYGNSRFDIADLLDFFQSLRNARKLLLSELCTLESKVLLCDFHREKAWLEWTFKSDNGTAAVNGTVLSLLRNIAHARATEEAAAAVLTLKNSTHWDENEKMRNWFGKKWLPNIEDRSGAEAKGKRKQIHDKATGECTTEKGKTKKAKEKQTKKK